ncbi:hypothetical protein BDV93DRAFT_609465, partial [Ceratobasidium sp. AG-I]
MAELTLNFYVRNDTRKRSFMVSATPDLSIQELLLRIQALYRLVTDDRKITNAALYQFDKPETDDLDSVCITAPQLQSRRKVSDFWSGSINPEHIHVFVDPGNVTFPGKESTTPEDGVSDLPSTFQRLEITQETTANSFLVGRPTSEPAKVSNFTEQQVQDEVAIRNGRPFEKTGPLVQLYHDVFHRFTEGINSNEVLPASAYANTGTFLYNTQNLYLTEESRMTTLLSDFLSFFNLEFTPENVVKCRGGVLKAMTIGSGPEAYCAVLELENEMGAGDSDPSVQAAHSYAIYWSQKKMEALRKICCCPSLIIAVAGPWMCILGAVYLDHVVVQPLTDFIWLANHPAQGSRLGHLTRILHSLTASVRYLETYYQSLPLQPRRADPARFFPYPRRYQAKDGSPVDFTYEGDLIQQQGMKSRAIFKARTKNDVQIVVKFVERYCTEAHHLLADNNLAPQLLSDSSFSGIRMIVMEYVPGMDLDDYQDLKLSETKIDTLRTVRHDVTDALAILHEHNLVFGDLRSPNVIVTESPRSPERKGMLVDFDWCGTHEEVTYPFGMNQVDIRWPAGAEKGAVIRKEHDLAMLERMF